MTELSQPSFWVGNIPIWGKLILSPMDGITDLPFRVLCRRLGSAMSYTEFIDSMAVLGARRFLPARLMYLEEERPLVFQMYDDNPDRMVSAALTLEKLHPDIIDINMGCPAKVISARGAGAGLLKEPRKIAEMVQKMTAALSVPVTAKIRLGWDEASRNYLEVAKIIEGEGGKLLAVHGRTSLQGYKGQADWDAIAEIKQTVHIPVIGNGDVCTVADIDRMIRHTGCDGVMIGRAAIDNPWIFSRLSRDQVSPEEVQRVMIAHLQLQLDSFGQRGLMLFRKYAKRYLAPYKLPRELMNELMTCEDQNQFLERLDVAFERVECEGDQISVGFLS